MHWQQIAAIWLLCVILVGLAITGIVLYATRDRGQHASGQRPARRERETVQQRWQRHMDGAREFMERRSGISGVPARPPLADTAAIAQLTQVMWFDSMLRVRKRVNDLASERRQAESEPPCR